jgi:hypothetical protein
MAIALSVFQFTASGFLFGFYKLFIKLSSITIGIAITTLIIIKKILYNLILKSVLLY